MRVLSAREAVKNFHRSQNFAQWSEVGPETAKLGYEVASGNMGGARVFTGMLTPSLAPKFKIPPASSIFTSGSCFAREIELAFDRAGERVLSWTPEVKVPGQFFHRYNTFSIANDFVGAMGTEPYDDRLAMETPAGWMDYSFYGPTKTQKELVDYRNRVFEIHRNISIADVLIITLGLIEVWFDKRTEKYLNFTPSEILSSNLSRFECRITNYEENFSAVSSLLSEIRKVSKPEMKIIITVSPVPLNVTFSGQDITVANMLSKSTLRAVAQAICDLDEQIDYFPSYEMVILSDPALAWLPDYRHVRPAFVSHIVDTFRTAYMTV